MAVRTRSTTTRKATTKPSRGTINLDNGKPVVFGDENGVCAVVSAFMHDGKLRTGGAAVTFHTRGADKPAAKGLTAIALAVFDEYRDEISAEIERMDVALKIGAHAPAKPATAKGIDPAKVAALDADEQKVLAALLAKLS